MNSNGFICLHRCGATEELLRDGPAFMLLTLIVLRARWSETISLGGLRKGDALVGADDVGRSIGLSPKQYRNAISRLVRYGQVTVVSKAGVGTVATVCAECIFSVTVDKRADSKADPFSSVNLSERADLGEQVGQKRGRRGAIKEQGNKERNESSPQAELGDQEFFALAIAEGSDPKQLTKTAAKTIAVALAQIREVMPDVSAGEIAGRAVEYRRVMPAGTRITAMALAKHWARCGGKIVPMPKFENASPIPAQWRAILEQLHPGNLINAEARPWESLPEAIMQKVRAAVDHSSKEASA